MPTVALIGVDGAGKTTIANMLLESSPVPLKYLYMGTSIGSSNYALPTSRLILYWKLRSQRKHAQAKQDSQDLAQSAHELEHRNVQRGRIGATLRTLNRMAEEWYRQFVAWSFQFRGYVVLCDRHFCFEYAAKIAKGHKVDRPLIDRIHLWSLTHLYPQPELVILLDAPAAVLMSRKQEWTLAHIQRQRMALQEQTRNMPHVVAIDASQPIDAVFADVVASIQQMVMKEQPVVSSQATSCPTDPKSHAETRRR